MFPEGVEVLTEGSTEQLRLSCDDVLESCLRSGPLLVTYHLRDYSDVRAQGVKIDGGNGEAVIVDISLRWNASEQREC